MIQKPTLYFLSDGKPNRDPYGGYWGSSDESPMATYYSDLNEDRDEPQGSHHITGSGIVLDGKTR